MLKRALLSATILLFPASALADDGEELSFGVGSNIFWLSMFDSSRDQFAEQIVGKGDDFVIYKTLDDPIGSPEDYFAVFSGIDYRGCDVDMPTEEERAAVAALWPLEPGKEANVVAYDDPATIRVGEATDFFLMGRSWPAHEVLFDYDDDTEANDEQMVVLDALKLTVRLRWNETEVDMVTLVSRPKDNLKTDLSAEEIGNCAELLTQSTE